MKSICFTILCSFLCTYSAYPVPKERHDERNVKVVSKSWIGAGLFAELKHVIYNLIYRSDHKTQKTLIVDWYQEFFPYKDDPACNGWDLYFEPINSHKVFENRRHRRPPEPKHIHSYCIQRWLRYKEYLPYRRYIHDRFTKYITFKPHVLQEVDAFYNKHLKDHFCIGMHVRFATAHGSENPYHSLVTLQDFINEAKDQFERHREERPKIFIATDSYFVIEEFKKHFNASQIAFTNAFRARYNEDPHLIYEHQKYYLEHPEEFHKRKPGYLGGLMTFVDCLLLSKCSVMIHSLSNVTDFAAWFNPDIESIFLPKGVQLSPCPCENVSLFFTESP
jgi:hypothetical protein